MSADAQTAEAGRRDLPEVGDVVEDRKADSSKPMLVLDVHPNSTVRGWYLYDIDSLLLDAFPETDPMDRVVTTAYVDELFAKVSVEDVAGAADLADAAANAGVQDCDYPASRLTARDRDGRLLADGGQQYWIPELGEFVEDRREDGGGEKMVVLNTHPTATAKGWYIDEEDATLAELNWEHDPMAPVVTVAYTGEFVSKVTLKEIATEQEAIEAAENAGVETYDFPAPRLKPAEADP